jgi:Flp pilus assembly protein TadD
LRRNRNIREDYERSMNAISKALELEPDLSEAYTALCENHIYVEFDFAAAERDCKHAVDLNPNSSAAHEIYARFLATRGRHDESITEITTAVDLEPTSVFIQRNLGITLFYARRYEEAVVQLKRVVEMDPNYWSSYSWLYDICGIKGDGAAAFEWFNAELARKNTENATVESFAAAFRSSGWKGVMEEQARRFDRKNDPYYTGAIYSALSGDKDKAFELLERSFQDREWGMAYLLLEPRLDNLRDDPRLADLVGRVESTK